MALIRGDLAALGVRHDVFTSERALIEAGRIDEALGVLDGMGLLYTGTLPPPKGGKPADDWEPVPQLLFRSTAYGDEIDRPLKRSNGAWTYFAADLAYHLDKFRRGFPLMVDVWGADHGGYVKRMQAAVRALTQGEGTLDVRLCQLVNLLDGGKPMKMSKRAGRIVTLRDVVDEVGRDVVRFIMLTRKNDAPLDFDFAKVTEQSKDNPVFYVQYAHARICSVFRNAREAGHGRARAPPCRRPISACSPIRPSSRCCARWRRSRACWRVRPALRAAPDRLLSARPGRRLPCACGRAARRSRACGSCSRTMPELTQARLAMLAAVRSVIATGLGLMGVQPGRGDALSARRRRARRSGWQVLDAEGVVEPWQEPRQGRGWLILLLGLVVFAAFGGVVGYAYFNGLPGIGGEPPLIRAAAEPYRSRAERPRRPRGRQCQLQHRQRAAPAERDAPRSSGCCRRSTTLGAGVRRAGGRAAPAADACTAAGGLPTPAADGGSDRDGCRADTRLEAGSCREPDAARTEPSLRRLSACAAGRAGGRPVQLAAREPPATISALPPPGSRRRPQRRRPGSRHRPPGAAERRRRREPAPAPRSARRAAPRRPGPGRSAWSAPSRRRRHRPQPPRPATGAGIYRLQLAAVRSEGGPDPGLGRPARSAIPTALAAVSPQVERTETSSGPLFRLQAGPFA